MDSSFKEKYRLLVENARDAFSKDASYGVMIAKQAGIFMSKKATKKSAKIKPRNSDNT